MSHFAQMQVVIKDKNALIDALVSCGVPRAAIEIHNEAQQIMDYCGNPSNDLRADERFKTGDKAHVIIRKKHLGSCRNDIGFYIDKEKSVAFVCDYTQRYDSPIFKNELGNRLNGRDWLAAVKQNYSLNVAKKHYSAQGKKVHVEKDVETGKMHLYVRA